MSKLLKIGNVRVKDNWKEFFFDGCHKIYIIEDEEDKKDFLTNKGYDENDIYKIEDLENVFNDSCPLRFINTCKFKTVVPQCRKYVRFFYDDKINVVRF